MLSKLRKNMVIIFAVVIVFFVLFIFLEWGMDIMGSDMRSAREKRYVGEAAGVKISWDVFNSKYNNMRSAYLMNAEKSSLTEEEDEQIAFQAFHEITEDIIFSKIEKQYGYFATEREIQDIVLNVPPQEIRGDERFFQDGKFNINAYRQVITDPNNREYYESYYRQIQKQVPRMKMQMDVVSGAKVEIDEILREIKMNETKFMVEYIAVPNTIEREVSVGDEEIRKYYENNRDNFVIEDQAELSIIYVPKEPSSQDILMTRENIETLRDDIINGRVSFENAAKLYSEDYNSAQNNGDLGYFKKGVMVKEFEEAAFALKNGEISLPIKTGFGWHIIKMEDNRRDSVKAKHILVKSRPSAETVAIINEKMQNVLKEAKTAGFEETAKKYNYNIIKTQPFNPKMGYIFELGGPARRVCSFADAAKIGSMEIIEERDGFVIAKIENKLISGEIKLEDIYDIVKTRIFNEKKRMVHSVRLSQDVKNIKDNNKSLKAYASENGYMYNKTDYITTNDKIEYVSPQSRFYGGILVANKNKVYYAVDDNYGYIFKVLDRIDVDIENSRELVDKYHQMLINERQQMVVDVWLNSLGAQFDVKNYMY